MSKDSQERARRMKLIRRKVADAGGLMGVTEVAAAFGVPNSNLDKIANLPDPLDSTRGGRIWIREEIEAAVAERAEKRRQVDEALVPA